MHVASRNARETSASRSRRQAIVAVCQPRGDDDPYSTSRDRTRAVLKALELDWI